MKISHLERYVAYTLLAACGQLNGLSVVGNSAAIPLKELECQSYTQSQRAYIKHIEGKGVGYNQGYTTLGAFLTPGAYYSSVLPFLDLRAHIFNNRKFASNAGVGVRYLSDKPRIYGGQFFYDFRRSHRHSYNQIGVGFEVLSQWWETRINGYLPVGDKIEYRKHKETFLTFDRFSGNELIFSEHINRKKEYEFAMKGADAEVGMHLIKPSKDYTLFAGIGPYYYDGYFGKHAWGGKVRVQAKLTEYVFFEISDSYDSIFHNKFQGQVSLSVPLGKKLTKKPYTKFTAPCSQAMAIQDMINLPPHRQEIIVLDKHTRQDNKTFTFVASSGGAPLHFLFVNNTNTPPGTGTIENPFNTLNGAQTASVPGDFIYVFAGDGTTAGMNTGFVFKDNQELLGSGIPQTIPTQLGNVVIPALTANSPEITAPGIIVTLANNDVLSGFAILQSNAAAAVSGAAGVRSPTVKNNAIKMAPGATSPAIVLTNPAGRPSILSNNLMGNGNGTTGVNITSNTPPGPNGASDPSVQGNTMTGFTVTGVLIQTSGVGQLFPTIENNIVTNNATGVQISVANTSIMTLTVQNNTVTNNTGNGVLLSIANSPILQTALNANTITSNGQQGVNVAFGGTTLPQVAVNLLQNTISANGLDGLVANPNNGISAFTMTNNVFTNNGNGGSAGIITNSNTATTTANLTFNTGNNDLFFDNSASGVFNLAPLIGNSIEIDTAGPITPVP